MTNIESLETIDLTQNKTGVNVQTQNQTYNLDTTQPTDDCAQSPPEYTPTLFKMTDSQESLCVGWFKNDDKETLAACRTNEETCPAAFVEDKCTIIEK